MIAKMLASPTRLWMPRCKNFERQPPDLVQNVLTIDFGMMSVWWRIILVWLVFVLQKDQLAASVGLISECCCRPCFACVVQSDLLVLIPKEFPACMASNGVGVVRCFSGKDL